MDDMVKCRCFQCGHELIWDSDYMQSDIGMVAEDEDDAIVQCYTCPECGTSYEVYYPKDELNTQNNDGTNRKNET